MGIAYKKLAFAIALRANQLTDALTAADLNTAYEDDLSNAMDGMEVPVKALKTDIINVEAEIAAMIGQSANIQLRSARRRLLPDSLRLLPSIQTYRLSLT